MSTTVTWRSRRMRLRSGRGTSPRIEVRDVRLRRVEAAQEGVDRALADGVARPAIPDRSFLGQPAGQQVDQVAEGADLFAFDDGAAVVDLLRLFAQARGHVVDHDRVLLAVVFGVGEQEAQKLLGAELVEGPEERGDRVVAAADVGGGAARVALGRRPELDALKRCRLEAEVHVAIELGGVLPDRLVGSVEEEEVLALDVEDQRLGVRWPRCRALRSERARRAGRWRRWSWWPRPRCRRC